jgi:2-polyprenyl-6-methoxyphenol hydroxylase-like FAD-dependent oxidoreductase
VATAEPEQVDVAVVGAGFGGLGVAVACAKAGLSVTVLERRPELAPEGVGLVLQPNGLAVLEELGVIDQVLAVGQQVSTARQCDSSGRVRAMASYRELRHPHPHPYLVVIERSSLISVLAGRLPGGATLRTGCKVSGLERENGRVCGVRYAHGSGAQHTLRAACVVAADGINSVIRDDLAPQMRWRTGPDRCLIGLTGCRPTDDAVVQGLVRWGAAASASEPTSSTTSPPRTAMRCSTAISMRGVPRTCAAFRTQSGSSPTWVHSTR